MQSKISFTGSLVLYNNCKEDVNKVIECFLESKNSNRLFIIDNSENDKFSYLKEREKINYIKTNENIGFGRAHNVALRKITSDKSSNYHVILNPDITFSSETIFNLINVMMRIPNIGLISPKILNTKKEQEFLCKLIPTPLDLILRLSPKEWFCKKKKRFQLKNLDYNKPISAPYLSGCFMVVDLFKIEKLGFFDDRFFMYPEDIDLTRRINEVYNTLYWPFEEIIHKHEKASLKSLKMFLIHITNMFYYFNKWGWFFDKKRNIQNELTLNQNQEMYSYFEQLTKEKSEHLL